MNTGFSNLDTLKQHLLAPALRASATYDFQLMELGLGMAAAVEQFCNRKLARVENDVEIISADRCQFLLQRYPVESVSAIDLKMTEAGGWVSQTVNDFLRTINQPAGIVNCPQGGDAGPWDAQVRFTYTGGYFWNTVEPSEAGYPAALPTGATALPSDLRLAWLLQCKHVWQTMDPRGTQIVAEEKSKLSMGDLELIPQVKQMLSKYVRMNLV